MDYQARSTTPRKTAADATGAVVSPGQEQLMQPPQPGYGRDEPPVSPGSPKYGGLVQTSADARHQKKLENRACSGAPYKGYSSYLSYIIGFGWLLPSNESGPQAAMRIRRSMSSRITFDSKNPPPDDYQ